MPIGDRHSGSSSGSDQPTITRTVTKQVVPFESGQLVDPDVLFTKKHEEWVTNKRVVNHKIKQVETRVQRQLILEDGVVVADSGPQVTTKTTEDVKVEESENTQHKTTGDDPPGPGYVAVPGSAKVVSEKTESTQTVTETKEENKQLHDENFRDLTGEELHQRIVVAPDNFGLVGKIGDSSEYPGTLTHFSSRSQKVIDKNEVKEVSELKDGELTTETTRTHHHEEAFDDEVPEDECEEGAIPERSAETSRTLQYYHDPKEFNAVAEKLQQESRRSQEQVRNGVGTSRWLMDNFGIEAAGSENTRTTAGGNKITIEMAPPKTTAASDLSPRGDTWNRESTSRGTGTQYTNTFDRMNYKKELQSTFNGRSPSPLYPSSTRNHVSRSPMSPAGASTSSSSSRSKTPVKTYYLGEDDSYVRDSHRLRNKPPRLNDTLKSSLQLGSSLTTNGRSSTSHYGTYSSEKDHLQRKSSSLNHSFDSDQLQRHTYRAKPIYTKIQRSKSDKNIQVSMSDDEEEQKGFSRIYREEPYGSYSRVDDRGTMSLLRTSGSKIMSNASNQSTLGSRSRIKLSKSSEMLSTPSSRYTPPVDYDYTDSRRSLSPIRISPRSQNGKGSRTEIEGRNEYNYANSYSHHSKHNEIKSSSRNNHVNSYSSYPRQNGQERYHSDYSSRIQNSDSMKKLSNDRYYKNSVDKGMEYSPHHKNSKPANSLIYRSSPSPSSSPPPRLIRVMNSDHYGSSSSLSPPDSPLHNTAHWTPSRGRSSGYSSTSRSKSSGDLRSPQLVSPSSFSAVASPSDSVTLGSRADRQKFYRVKPGNDGKSVVVQVREWNDR